VHMKLKTANYNVKYFLPKSNNIETIIGIQGMHQTNLNFGEERLIPDATINDFGAFMTSNYEWGKNAIQAGIRFDKRSISTSEYGIVGDEGYFEALDKQFESFNFALGYKSKLTEKITARFNLASGFRAPNLSELTSNGVHEGSNRYEIGNSNLENEQNFQADLNLEYNSEHFEIFVNGFYNHVNNYIYIEPTSATIDGNDVYNYVQNNAYLFGGEAGIHFHPHPLDWLHFTSSFENVTAKQENGDYLPLIPANQWKNNLKTNFNISNWFQKNYISAQINHTFNQNNTSDFESQSKDYTLVNIGFGGEINFGKRKVDVYFNANNLFDKNYIAHLSRLKNDGIPNIGRNIVLGLNFDF